MANTALLFTIQSNQSNFRQTTLNDCLYLTYAIYVCRNFEKSLEFPLKMTGPSHICGETWRRMPLKLLQLGVMATAAAYLMSCLVGVDHVMPSCGAQLGLWCDPQPCSGLCLTFFSLKCIKYVIKYFFVIINSINSINIKTYVEINDMFWTIALELYVLANLKRSHYIILKKRYSNIYLTGLEECRFLMSLSSSFSNSVIC